MTGIERLFEVVRELGRFSFCYDLYETLGSIADQIERERACDADTIENIRLIVGRVIDDMERHVSGVDGADDSPVARWARELREAMGGEEHDPAADVSMSAYDLLPADERKTIAWVREHGGLDSVKKLLDQCRFTHRAPVLAADGRPLREGETVYGVNTGYEYTVAGFNSTTDEDGDPCVMVVCKTESDRRVDIPSNCLTHERPESKCRDCAHWQKDPTADNMGVCWFFYHEYEGEDCYAARRADIGACEEFMPRVSALAERERGE